MTSGDGLTPEQRARVLIDEQLRAASWHVCDMKDIDVVNHRGTAVREVRMKVGHGQVDYLLYVDHRIVGVIEAKPEGKPLSGVEWQSAMYATGLSKEQGLAAVTVQGRLPFVFEMSGSETHFTNGYDPRPRARRLFHVPRPEVLARWQRDAEADPTAPTWRSKVAQMPELRTEGLRPAQVDAIRRMEKSLADQRHDRSLVQMATGAGKTFTAVTESYRLLKHGGFRRVLFLVDRDNLGDQTIKEFRAYETPGDGRKFTELYNVDALTSAGLADSSSVVISTIQRVYAALRGEEVPEGDDPGLDGAVPERAVEVAYNRDLPPESFDLVIVDECHRSIYGVWQGVLDYFDAHVIGLTATPTKQTLGFFRQNLVSEYTYRESVADGVNVDFDVYRIRTRITEQGETVDAGTTLPVRDKRTRKERYQTLDDDLNYTPSQLDRAVTSTSQLDLVLSTFRERVFTEVFPGRRVVPKTLIFAKDDNHAEEVVTRVRQVFGEGNDFAAKITYSAKDARKRLQEFRNSPTLRIAVTVDMIATGTDVKPLECLVFLRDVRSATYFEQMKGRGARTIKDEDFQAVTPDSMTKDRFVIVDCVGVTEHDLHDAAPLDRDRSVSLEKLLQKAATLTLTEAETSTLASRLTRLDLQLDGPKRDELEQVGGQPLTSIVKGLLRAVDPDVQAATDGSPQALRNLVVEAVKPLAGNPELGQRILDIRRQHDQYIDHVSIDELLEAGGVVDEERARSVVESWHEYLAEHRDEITAIQVVQEAKAAGKRVSFRDVKELAQQIRRPPRNWTPDVLWAAYSALPAEYRGVKHSGRRTMTDLVSLLRYALKVDDELVPYAEQVRERYAAWLQQQENAGVEFTDEQRWWLDRMADVVAQSAGITADDLEASPFAERGGVEGALAVLGDEAGEYVEQLDRELTA